MQTAYRFLRQIWPYIGPVIGLLALGRVFDVQLGDAILGTFTAVRPYLTGAKIGWFLLGTLSLFFSYVEIRHRGVPLTATETDVTVLLQNPSGNLATVTRTQRLRANHENVTGYTRMLSSTGTVPRESIEFNVDHCNGAKQKLEIDGAPQKWEVIHRFDAIPRNLFKLGLNTVRRTESYRIIDGFCSSEESYEMLIPKQYRHERITMTIYFHPDNACDIKDCEALWISDNGIVELNLTRPDGHMASGRPGIQLKVSKPRGGDRYRIKWKNPQGPKAIEGALVPANS